MNALERADRVELIARILMRRLVQHVGAKNTLRERQLLVDAVLDEMRTRVVFLPPDAEEDLP